MVHPVHLTGVSLLSGRLEFGCHKRKKGHEQNIKAFQLSSGDLKTRKLREICQPEVQFSLFFIEEQMRFVRLIMASWSSRHGFKHISGIN